MDSDQNSQSNNTVPASKIHIPQMVAIFRQGQNQHHDLFPKIFCPPDNQEKIVQYLNGYLKPRNPLRTRKNYSLVWCIDDIPVGYVLYQIHHSSNVFFGDDRWMCFVDDIAIDTAHHGKGGGSTLLQRVIEHTEQLKNCIIHAQVWRGNEASKALFNKFNFDDTAINFYRLPNNANNEQG